MLWVRVPPEAADFSLKKPSSGVVELCCVYWKVSRSLFIMYILGLEFGVFGGLINPVCSVCLLIKLSCFEMPCLALI